VQACELRTNKGNSESFDSAFPQGSFPPSSALQPVGRPIAASDAQQDRVLKLRRAGRSSRWIAEEIGLSRRTVTTVIEKSDGTDRTTSKRRVRLGLEPKRNVWRQAAITNLPRRATGLRKEAKKLLKEARDGRA
jgi:hypothetical protein